MTPTSSPITALCSSLTTTPRAVATCRYRCVSATSLPSHRPTTRPSPAPAAASQRANCEEETGGRQSLWMRNLLQQLEFVLAALLQGGLPLVFILAHGLHHRMGHCQVPVPLVVGRYDIPGAVVRAAFRQRVLVR